MKNTLKQSDFKRIIKKVMNESPGPEPTDKRSEELMEIGVL